MEDVAKRRDSYDILADILKVARRGMLKSNIILKARISYSQVNEYATALVKRGFLEKTTVKRKKKTLTMYRTTQKGVEFLDHIEFIDKLWE